MERYRRDLDESLARPKPAGTLRPAPLFPVAMGVHQAGAGTLFLGLLEGAPRCHQRRDLNMARGLFDLSGKVVLATGANSGIGLAFLQGCAKQGADVVVWGRRVDKNAEALEALKAMGAPRAYAVAVDVSDEAAVEAAFASTLEV